MEGLRSNTKLVLITILAAAVFALVVGTITNFVKAVIPAQDGTISACYRTNGGDLRVRDTANAADTCSNKEMALSWNSSQSGGSGTKSALVYIDEYNQLDPSRSRNLISYSHVDGTEIDQTRGYCLNLGLTPHVMLVNFIAGGGQVALRDQLPNGNGQIVDQYCSANDNAFSYETTGPGYFWFSE